MVAYTNEENGLDKSENIHRHNEESRSIMTYSESMNHRLRNKPHRRLYGNETPEYLQYEECLKEYFGLFIHPVEGDGNCLFRSFSDQIYGTDTYHQIIREKCMDYMIIEKEYFKPYVVGNMDGYMRYIEWKRQDGVWGDDPELQALSELYDCPIEIYAFDRYHGAKKLRTFHEESMVYKKEVTVRLSYYGGGHYDSLKKISFPHERVINLFPGVWEDAKISQRRNLQRSSRSDPLAEHSDDLDKVVKMSDHEATERAQYEQVLKLSREEFALNNNLDDTFLLAQEQKDLQEVLNESERMQIQEDLIESAKKQSADEMQRLYEKNQIGWSSYITTDDEALKAAINESRTMYEQNESNYDADLQKALELSLKQV